MKHMKRLLAMLLAVALLAGCNGDNNGQEQPGAVNTEDPVTEDHQAVGTIADYFLFEADVEYVYTGDTVLGEQVFYNTYYDGGKLQRKASGLNISKTEVFEYENGELTVYSPDIHWFEKAGDSDLEGLLGITILKEPLSLGSTWDTVAGNTSMGTLKGTSEITDIAAVVETPMGTFETIEVTTEYEGVNYEKNYYAKGTGLVMTQYYTQSVGGQNYTSAKAEATILLSQVNKGQGHAFDVFVCYPDDMIEDIDIELWTLTLHQGETLISLIEDTLKSESPSGKPGLISANTKINFIDVKEGEDLIHVDLSSDFITDLNAGVGYEVLLLDSIGLTFMYLYNHNNVWLTIDGDNYSSGHFSFADGDYLNYEEIMQSLEEEPSDQ